MCFCLRVCDWGSLFVVLFRSSLMACSLLYGLSCSLLSFYSVIVKWSCSLFNSGCCWGYNYLEICWHVFCSWNELESQQNQLFGGGYGLSGWFRLECWKVSENSDRVICTSKAGILVNGSVLQVWEVLRVGSRFMPWWPQVWFLKSIPEKCMVWLCLSNIDEVVWDFCGGCSLVFAELFRFRACGWVIEGCFNSGVLIVCRFQIAIFQVGEDHGCCEFFSVVFFGLGLRWWSSSEFVDGFCFRAGFSSDVQFILSRSGFFSGGWQLDVKLLVVILVWVVFVCCNFQLQSSF